MDSKTDLSKTIEDTKELEKLATNDIDMAANGFIFDKGDLDFYLQSSLNKGLKGLITEIKEAQGI